MTTTGSFNEQSIASNAIWPTESKEPTRVSLVRKAMLLPVLVLAIGFSALAPTAQPASAHSTIEETCFVGASWTNHFWSVFLHITCEKEDRTNRAEFHRIGQLGQRPDGSVTTKEEARRAGGPYGLKRCSVSNREFYHKTTIQLSCRVPLKPHLNRVKTCIDVHGDNINGSLENVHRSRPYPCPNGPQIEPYLFPIHP